MWTVFYCNDSSCYRIKNLEFDYVQGTICVFVICGCIIIRVGVIIKVYVLWARLHLGGEGREGVLAPPGELSPPLDFLEDTLP